MRDKLIDFHKPSYDATAAVSIMRLERNSRKPGKWSPLVSPQGGPLLHPLMPCFVSSHAMYRYCHALLIIIFCHHIMHRFFCFLELER